MNKVDIVIAGVGGQGNLLLAKLIAEAALMAGLEAKRSEIKGLAQRGGPVQSLVKIGEQVWSPLVEKGQADLLLGLELVEALRNVQFLSVSGHAIVSRNFVPNPLPFSQPEMLARAQHRGFILISAADLAKQAGNAQSTNIVILGTASHFFPFGPELFQEALRKNVKRLLEENLQAFQLGREALPLT